MIDKSRNAFEEFGVPVSTLEDLESVSVPARMEDSIIVDALLAPSHNQFRHLPKHPSQKNLSDFQHIAACVGRKFAARAGSQLERKRGIKDCRTSALFWPFYTLDALPHFDAAL